MLCKNCRVKQAFKYSLYSSGNFCSRQCARAFATKEKRKEINAKVSKTLKRYPDKIIICLLCKKKRIVPGYRKYYKFCSIHCAHSYNSSRIKWSSASKKKLSNSLKKAYSKGRLFYGGNTKWYTINTSNGIIRVRGNTEHRACKILDFLKYINQITDWEYTSDRIRYLGMDKKYHFYLIDFKIFTQNSFYYIETKSGLLSKKDKIKLNAVLKSGSKIIVWFKKNLRYYEQFMGRYPNVKEAVCKTATLETT